MEAADGNYGARLEYTRHMETVVGKIFEIFEEIDEMNRIAEALDQEYEDRIKNGKENDPHFQARWNADDGTQVRSTIVVLSRTFGDENDPRDGMLVLASNYETAMEITAIFRTDVQRTICTNYESAMRVIRDQMNMGAQFTLSPAAASA